MEEKKDSKISIGVKGHEIVNKIVFYHIIVKENEEVKCVCKMRFQAIEAFHNNFKISRFQPFPSKHNLALHKTSPEFIEKREMELDEYFTNFSHHESLLAIEQSVIVQYFVDVSKVPL